MKKRLVIMLATLLAAFVLATALALAYGNSFSFPAARRIVVSQVYSGTHQVVCQVLCKSAGQATWRA